MFAGPLALIALTAAAVRAGLVPRWTIAGAVLFFISDSLPIPAAEEIQGVIGLVTFAAVTLRLLTLTSARQPEPRVADALAAVV
jgi:hypothetical protein